MNTTMRKSAMAAVLALALLTCAAVAAAGAGAPKESQVRPAAAANGCAPYSTRRGMTLDEARALLAAECPGYSFSGDVVWLASTSVDGVGLHEHFRPGNAHAVEDARAAAAAAGFVFAGFQEDGERDGRRRIVVDKGRVGVVNVSFYGDEAQEQPLPDGDSRYSAEQIARRMGAGSAVRGGGEGEAFNFEDVKNRFAALNAHPDVRKANIALAPAGGYRYEREDGTPGQDNRAVAMDVKVTETALPVHVAFGVDNYGTVEGDESNAYAEGNWMGHAGAQCLNLWGLEHVLAVNASAAFNGELWGVTGGYLVPRRDDGTLLGAWDLAIHGGYTDVDEKDVIENVDVEGRDWFGGFLASARLAETGRSVLDFQAGVTYRNVESELDVTDPADGRHYVIKYGADTDGDGIVDDEGYEIVPLSLALAWADTALDPLGGRNTARLEGVYNLGGSGVGRLRGFREAIDEDHYWLVRAHASRLQLLGSFRDTSANGLWSLYLRASGQYSPTALVSAEQFAVGGHGTVRGYKERQFLGDSGAAGTVELRSPVVMGLFDRRASGGSAPLDRWQAVLFADAGWYDLQDAYGGKDDHDFLLGAGPGLRLVLGEHWQGRCDVGFPLERDDDAFDTDTCRVHLSVQCQW